MFTRDELIAALDLGGINGGNAAFNVEKLDWFNQQRLWRLSADELMRRVKPELEAASVWRDACAGARRDWFEDVPYWVRDGDQSTLWRGRV